MAGVILASRPAHKNGRQVGQEPDGRVVPLRAQQYCSLSIAIYKACEKPARTRSNHADVEFVPHGTDSRDLATDCRRHLFEIEARNAPLQHDGALLRIAANSSQSDKG